MAPGRKADVSARSNDAVGLGRGKRAQGAIRPSLTTTEVKAPSMDNFSLCPGLDDKERERSSSATDEAVKAKKVLYVRPLAWPLRACAGGARAELLTTQLGPLRLPSGGQPSLSTYLWHQ